jgi:hypothetical protein
MKRFMVFIPVFFLSAALAFSQETESPVVQFDEAVTALARNIHAKLVEKGAEKIGIGQFTFQNGTTPFNSYWVNQLMDELTNTSGRSYIILSGVTTDADWTISGEMVIVANIIRVYSRLIRSSDRAVEGSFFTSFQRNEHINNMLVFVNSGGGSSGGSGGGGIDSYEPDSWESPVTYTIGANSSTPVMNRSIDQGDEDFFLLVPERDGRLTAETTGNVDTYMYLYNYDEEEELSSNDDGGQTNNARINHNVRSGTRYLAVVRGYSGSTSGSYGFRAYLTVREGMSSWDNPVSYEIGIGEDNITPVSRTLQDGDEDYFLLVPERDGRLTIETTGRTDTYMELYEAESKDLLQENDDGGNGNNARIRYEVTAGQRYIVMVRGYSGSRGSYSFRAFFPGGSAQSSDEYEPDDDPAQAKSIAVGSTQQRTFHSGDDVDWITFEVTRAGRYIIGVRGATNNRLDTYIELHDSNLNLIAEDDDGGDSLSSRLSLSLNAGTYYIKVWCLDDAPDQGYTLSVTTAN